MTPFKTRSPASSGSIPSKRKAGRPGAAGPEIIAGDMVGMSVGVDNPAHLPAFLVQLRRETRGRPSRIHHQGLLAVRASNKIGDDLEGADFFGENYQGHALNLRSSRSALFTEETEDHLLVFKSVNFCLDGQDISPFAFFLGLAPIAVRRFILALQLIFLGLL